MLRFSSTYLGIAVLIAACENPVRPGGPPIPSAAVVPNIHNVLSAVAYIRAPGADSVAIQYRTVDATAYDATPPVVPSLDGNVTIPILGLGPSQRYVLHAVAYGRNGLTVSGPLDLKTGALPADLPSYVANGSDPAAGYVVFAAGRYGIVIDNTGRVVWYRHFPDGAGLSFMAQPTGHYVLRPPTPAIGDREPWLEVDALGNITRTLNCASGLAARPHDIILESDGSYWLLCDETRMMDLTTLGGVANARVTGTVVQHVGAAGIPLFQWSPFDHFEITDLDPAERTGSNVNWTHGNSLDMDTDGNLLVSFRSLGEITKIDASTGAVIWRLGGRRNEFTLVDTPVPAFARQHSVRACAPGTILLLDNVGDPRESRAERYTLDEAGRTARLLHSYGSAGHAMTEIGGSVQTLAGGRTLVSFGTAGRVEEYDVSGNLTWQIQGNAGYIFRAQRVGSLYAPGLGSAR